MGDFTAKTRVIINVEDSNEFSPIFPRNSHETQITEEDDRHLPKPILTVSKSTLIH